MHKSPHFSICVIFTFLQSRSFKRKYCNWSNVWICLRTCWNVCEYVNRLWMVKNLNSDLLAELKAVQRQTTELNTSNTSNYSYWWSKKTVIYTSLNSAFQKKKFCTLYWRCGKVWIAYAAYSFVWDFKPWMFVNSWFSD